MRIFYGVLVLAAFCLPAFSQETFTLTTYYPAPFGVYQEMRINNRLAVGDANGDGVIDNNDFAHDDTTGEPINGTITVGNSIGIGTTSPDSELDITATDSTDGNATITLTSVYPASGMPDSTWEIEALGPGGNDGTGANAGGLQFTTTDAAGNTTRPVSIERGADDDSLYIDSDGNVGIGTNDPQSKLDVDGEVRIGDSGLECNENRAGTIRYNSGQIQYCTGTEWSGLGGINECVAVRKKQEKNLADADALDVVYSSRGTTYAPTDLVEIATSTNEHNGATKGNYIVQGIRCKDGWLATGCSNYRYYDQYDEDNIFFEGICGDVALNKQYNSHGYTISCCR